MSALAPQGAFPPAPGPGGPPPGSDGPDSTPVEQLLMVAKAALQKAEQAETDHIDMAAINKCITAIQAILASRQQGAESALGVTPAHKAMSRAYGQQ